MHAHGARLRCRYLHRRSRDAVRDAGLLRRDAPRCSGQTRLVTRLRIHLDWSHKAISVFSVVLNELGDFAMMRRMLLGIRQRAEGTARSQ
jgi:hypothetical protein